MMLRSRPEGGDFNDDGPRDRDRQKMKQEPNYTSWKYGHKDVYWIIVRSRAQLPYPQYLEFSSQGPGA